MPRHPRPIAAVGHELAVLQVGGDDVDAQLTTDAVEHKLLLGLGDAQHETLGAHASRAPRAMHVVGLVRRQLEIEHRVHLRDVDASRGEV